MLKKKKKIGEHKEWCTNAFAGEYMKRKKVRRDLLIEMSKHKIKIKLCPLSMKL